MSEFFILSQLNITMNNENVEKAFGQYVHVHSYQLANLNLRAWKMSSYFYCTVSIFPANLAHTLFCSGDSILVGHSADHVLHGDAPEGELASVLVVPGPVSAAGPAPAQRRARRPARHALRQLRPQAVPRVVAGVRAREGGDRRVLGGWGGGAVAVQVAGSICMIQ